ncbi:maleylpyruvate isomerase family mycothiol-dependent enzyme [Streptomyces sp. YU58]|uniref:maleylpyruvate isomerase family mycothiol-dependent enzyme n=1 Tax=Streptomyces sp. SX92 TaxID=3158972 RepID=UPI0027BB1354|nr:maleylpyruvate isomerase family mycothiol-dependent enzyme [Streptomyces coralus]WLW57342.1 maleylpyruvate isomerase family mycothiol-dependent enzyme [Streptomyces coralus]
MSSEPDHVPGPSWLGDPIDARPLFGPELEALLGTLRGLRPDDWCRTALPRWTVQDVAAHILGDYHGRLGRGSRTAFAPGETLEAFIHRTNQEWVDLRAGDSPASLVEALEEAGTELAARFASADLAAPSLGVSWAGVDPAPGWLDIAREFTEYWTHRQQIRHAVGRSTDPEPHALARVLDTFMRALPHTLRRTTAPVGTQVDVIAEGSAGGRWTVTAGADRWSLAAPRGGRPAASVALDTETAWLMCTRGIEPGTALGRARVRGERRLAEAVCRIVAIVR